MTDIRLVKPMTEYGELATADPRSESLSRFGRLQGSALNIARCGMAARTALHRHSRPRLALSAIVIAIAAAADLWLATYKSLNNEQVAGIPIAPQFSHATLVRFLAHQASSPAWVVLSALGIGLLGLAAAAILLQLRRTAVVLTLAAALAGALGLYDYLMTLKTPATHTYLVFARPGWVGPTSLAILLLGLAAAAKALVPARPSSPK
jgi:hypothetical protein